MRLGIIGLPGAGKTSIFNALTGADLPVGIHSSHIEVHTGVADIPDPRLESLSELYQPRKTTYAQITFGDIAGMGEDASLSGEYINHLAQWDGYLVVLRAFKNPLDGAAPNPEANIKRIEAEFVINDLLRVESQIERLEEERGKGARDRSELDHELDLQKRIAEALQSSRPLRTLDLGAADQELLAGYGLITIKPLLLVVNLDEGTKDWTLDSAEPAYSMHGKLEAELAQLSTEEAVGFRQEFGISQAEGDGLMAACLDLLQLFRFYTVSDAEVKAWLLQEGSTAQQAAGTIHTDMARGFIRAEVIDSQKLIDFGGLSESRAAGKLRVEGKEYIPIDGEVIHIRFNV